jgi:hypothetical protein
MQQIDTIAVFLFTGAVLTVVLSLFEPELFGFVYLLFSVDWIFRLGRRVFEVKAGNIGCSRLVIGLLVMACLLIILLTLFLWADQRVRSSWSEKVIPLEGWFAAWIWMDLIAILIGIDLFPQVFAQHNQAVLWAYCGMLGGMTLAVAGANIGEGPTEATTLGPLWMAFSAYACLWIFFHSLTWNTYDVTVDRDDSAGIRLSSLLLSLGLILGRSVAGDWVSIRATWWDFGWQGLIPSLLLVATAIALEYQYRIKLDQISSHGSAGIVPASVYLCLAVIWVWWLGPW